ncbi:transcriptional regulator [Pseudomonas sp. Ost2]|nr:TetR family transcriptional regulator C-terminal domain-containing protein [Pseudomonas gingeri]NWE48661.1 TetR family transcriptional regulator C-terminal domain-containing protein [Pseudomonas gingeri]NWE67739.1 TetR family transcriptional regulator C-terminal domain-containing protein [Pseudomonas gingeri]BBP77716.1 transcriptional regulator [Pseudomonas sp. Ost2]
MDMAVSQVREKLIEAGLSIIATQGFNGTGVQEIADLAGVPKGSFYNYFDSKDAFAVEVLERYWQKGRYRVILSDESLGDPLVRLRHYFEALAAARVDDRFLSGCLIGNFSSELSEQSRLVRDRLSEIYAGWARALEICIREAQDLGLVGRDVAAAELASFVLNAWQGAVLRTKVEKDGLALQQFMTVVFKRVLV